MSEIDLTREFDSRVWANNGENDGYIHTYSDLCSCGKCHMSYLLSSAIQQYFQSYLTNERLRK